MSKNGVEITDDLREDFGNGNLSDLRPIIGDKAVNYYITFYDDMIQEVLDDWNRTFASMRQLPDSCVFIMEYQTGTDLEKLAEGRDMLLAALG